ncbi:MAG: pyrroline-5-carboxylate reductase [Desulfococcaceae bacterium]|jgi:pyrroline-5-carboxylate reductase|nr:pyrroline-5-carboxylate reductase [Desulfococcaceae bacterium]
MSRYGKIGFIGAGNMGEAIIGALIRSEVFSPADICITDLSRQRADMMQKEYQVTVMADNASLFSACQMIMLAVKPQQMTDVLTDISTRSGYGVSERKLLISIAAGFRMEKIENILYAPLDEAARKNLPVVRVMPNTPALVLSGISGMCGNRHAGPEDMAAARTVLAAMGDVIAFEEEALLDAVTGVSGSGPAYVFYLIEAMTLGGIRAGLPEDRAVQLTLTTVEGAARLMRLKGESAESLRKKVTSPGGTTEAAVKVLDDNHVRQHIADAVLAAVRRSEELSR